MNTLNSRVALLVIATVVLIAVGVCILVGMSSLKKETKARQLDEITQSL